MHGVFKACTHKKAPLIDTWGVGKGEFIVPDEKVGVPEDLASPTMVIMQMEVGDVSDVHGR